MTVIILASQSPRRRQLLSAMGVTFKVVPSEYDEKLDEARDAEIVAQELALGKARDVAKKYPNTYVIGSDTIVAVNGRQMEKPKDVEDAREMLLALSGYESTVSTGIAVINESLGIEVVNVATTKVHFFPDSAEIKAKREVYLASGDWHDKAGGYGIQSGAAPLIDCIEGDYDTVVGLPTRVLAQILSELGVEAHQVTEEPPVRQLTPNL